MELFFGVIIGLVVLTILVVAHELGHANTARRNGVIVEEFGIGFPPKVFAKKLKNGILFSINALPIGGFVKMQGEYDCADKKGDYGKATYWQKTKILLSGVLANWILAAVILTILSLVGMPKILQNQFQIDSDSKTTLSKVVITDVVKDLSAEKSGIKNGDYIISINGEKIDSSEELIEITKNEKGKQITVIYERDEVQQPATVWLGSDSDKGIFGASLGQSETVRSTWSAPIVGVVTTAQFTAVTFQGLGSLIAGIFQSGITSASESVAGPIGILGTIFPQASSGGVVQIAFLTAIISISFAVMNILPIPALDGGRWFVMTLFKLIRKKLTKTKEEYIQMAGFSLLMVLILLVTVSDISKLF